ncbi:MAG: glutamate--tRNA ligase [Rickettsiales bacterium]|jgi:glutamyl-tRNA synthetase|nr:glutamate--tRNA ligase [Rickettsiales bacterium]
MEPNEELAKKIFTEDVLAVEDIFNRYQARDLNGSKKITRFAPSPTGFMHIGNLYSAMVSERVAHSSDGIFFLRIEDTDEKREVAGAVDKIISTLDYFAIRYDEGPGNAVDFGVYGPYVQSKRKLIYKVFAKSLVERGLAYPCFCSEEELEEIANRQKNNGCRRLGYYGSWASYRNYPAEESIRKIEKGEEYVVRFKSPGNFNRKIVVNDILRGNVEFPENDLDIVILKKNFLPTYHFAHIVDDFLMGTNLVVRGDEWLPSLPIHIQLFQAMKWKAPRYAHISPLMKMDGNIRRKLSKRKDPEADVEYFDRAGYPRDSVKEYLINVANSNFENWRKQNPEVHHSKFPFDIKKMNVSGALFDFVKLDSVSKNVIGKMSAEEIYENTTVWARKYDPDLLGTITSNRELAVKIFSIERDTNGKTRKDIAKWSEVRNEIIYFFELDGKTVKSSLDNTDKDDVAKIGQLFLEIYNDKDSKEEWFEKMKIIARECNYADNNRDFKEQPEKFSGSISDVTRIIRILLTGREQGPDLYSQMNIMGRDKVLRRIEDGLSVARVD